MVEMLNHWIDLARRVIVETFSLFGLFDFLIFSASFLVFVLLYFLACLSANVRFFVPQILKFFAFLLLLGSPVGLFYVNQNLLYKIEVDYKMAKRLEYSPTFFIDATISNLGKAEIKQCFFVLKILREGKDYRAILLNKLKPIKSYEYPIKRSIPIGGKISYTQTINDFPYRFYDYSISCFGGK